MRAVLHPQYLGYISVVLVIAVMYVTSGRTIFCQQDSQEHNVASTMPLSIKQASTAVAHQRRRRKHEQLVTIFSCMRVNWRPSCQRNALFT